MRIALFGSAFGKFEHGQRIAANNRVDWCLYTGNVGIWPDPLRASRQARKHGTGEFLDYVAGKKRFLVPSLMVAGKHEDHWWINQKVKKGEGELVPNLHFLVSGNHTVIDGPNESLRIVGLGGTFSPKPSIIAGNYTKKDVAKACTAGPVDIFLAHETPHGEKLDHHISQAAGLNTICFATQPRLLVHNRPSCGYPLHYITKSTTTPALAASNHYTVIIEMDADNYELCSIHSLP